MEYYTIVYKELNDHHFAIAVFSSTLKAKEFVLKYYQDDPTILIQPVLLDPNYEVSFTSNLYPWSVNQ